MDYSSYQRESSMVTLALIECKSLTNRKDVWEDDLLEIRYDPFDDCCILTGCYPERFILRRVGKTRASNELVEFVRKSGLYKDIHIEWDDTFMLAATRAKETSR